MPIDEEALDRFIEENEIKAGLEFDDTLLDYVDPEDIDEYGGAYEAYCELGNGEAEDDVCYIYAHKFLGDDVDRDTLNRVQRELRNAWF